MAAMYDAAMLDFSADNVMDADMLPSASDSDWLQVENMIEDGDMPLPAEEVDMIHDDVQEYEMTDAREIDYGEYNDLIQPELMDHHLRSEPQDQEIPDASRASSPSLGLKMLDFQPISQPDTVLSLPQPQDAKDDRSEVSQTQLGDAPTDLPPATNLTTTHLVEETTSQTHVDEVPYHPPQHLDPHETTSQAEHGPGSAVVEEYETSTLSDGTVDRLPKGDPQATSTDEIIHHPVSADSAPQMSKAATGQFEEDVDNREPETHPEPESHNAKIHTVNNNIPSAEDEEESLIDVPPCVLLTFPFDGSRYALFSLSEEPQSSQGDKPVNTTAPASEQDNVTGSDVPVLLFAERFELYFEPISLVFQALRANETINVGGRFDQNVELVLSVSELDLTLPEDNIHAREVSLHDLGVLHAGCDLSGPLSLQLDTISPRFGTRYQAIRDEIVRAVSEDEQPDGLELGVNLTDEDQSHPLPEKYEQEQQEVTQDPLQLINTQVADPVVQTGDERALIVSSRSDSASGAPTNFKDDEEVESHRSLPEEEVISHGGAVADYAYGQSEEQARPAADTTEEYYDEDDEDGEYEGEDENYEDVEEQYFETVEQEPQTAPESQDVHNNACHEEIQAAQEHEQEEENKDEAAEEEEAEEAEGEEEAEEEAEAVVEEAEQHERDQDQEVPGGVESFRQNAAEDSERYTSGDAVDEYASISEVHPPINSVLGDMADPTERETEGKENATSEQLETSDIFTENEYLLPETAAHSSSNSPGLSTNIDLFIQDEVIAYEDALENGKYEGEEEAFLPGPQYSSMNKLQSLTPQAASAVSKKRSFDEHEPEQFEGDGPPENTLGDSKRLRVD